MYRRFQPDGADSWLIGPTWLYVGLAIVIFIIAAAVAVVQATGSSDESAAVQAADSRQGEPAAVADDGGPAQTSNTGQPETSPPPSAQPQPTQPVESSVVQQPEQQGDQEEQPAPAGTEGDLLRGFRIPIDAACITEFENHLPNANRAYRNDGVHEGLDFYQWASCTGIDESTPILAAKDGVVIRADLDYVDITPADWSRFESANWEGEQILDELRGRQVWIDHGRGIVTRYAHLSAIAPGIGVGVEVTQGQIIGYPGESGQREVYIDDENDVHLHFEIRVGDGWLGQDEPPQQARLFYLTAFGLLTD